MAEKERLSITKQEYDALNHIRGLGSDVNYMVICAEPTKTGRWVLEGSSEAFDSLSSDLSDEIYEELSPPSHIRHLAKLYARLNPDSDL